MRFTQYFFAPFHLFPRVGRWCVGHYSRFLTLVAKLDRGQFKIINLNWQPNKKNKNSSACISIITSSSRLLNINQ